MREKEKMKSYKTVIFKEDNKRKVVFHETVVVSHDLQNGQIKINSGGWKTSTTKDRINAYFKEYVQGFIRLYQSKWEWFVEDTDNVYPYKDGMTFKPLSDGNFALIDGQ